MNSVGISMYKAIYINIHKELLLIMCLHHTHNFPNEFSAVVCICCMFVIILQMQTTLHSVCENEKVVILLYLIASCFFENVDKKMNIEDL